MIGRYFHVFLLVVGFIVLLQVDGVQSQKQNAGYNGDTSSGSNSAQQLFVDVPAQKREHTGPKRIPPQAKPDWANRSAEVNCSFLRKDPQEISITVVAGLPDLVFTRTHSESENNHFSWTGNHFQENSSTGFASFTIERAKFFGFINFFDFKTNSQRIFEVASTVDALNDLVDNIDVLIYERNATAGRKKAVATGSGSGSHFMDTGSPRNITGDRKKRSDDGSVITLMVVWSTDVANSVPDIQTRALNAIATTNTIYRNSGIRTQLNLVYSGPINFIESGTMQDTIRALSSKTDGKGDEVHPLRDQYAADQVVMYAHQADNCGVGHLMTSFKTNFESWAFSVVHDDSTHACSNVYTMAHELGHNQGSQHNPEDSVGDVLYPYAYGHRLCQRGGWIGVMAYPCPGLTLPFIPYFANPTVLYNGVATGVVNARDNVRAINSMLPIIANWRVVRPPRRTKPKRTHKPKPKHKTHKPKPKPKHKTHKPKRKHKHKPARKPTRRHRH